MASSILVKIVGYTAAFSMLHYVAVHSVPFVPSVIRSFKTIAQISNYHDDERFSASGCNCRQCRGLISKAESERGMVKQTYRVGSDGEFDLVSTRGPGWEMKEDSEALYVKMYMFGFGKHDVQITLDSHNSLVIKGEAAKEFGNNNDDQVEKIRCGGQFDIPAGLCDIDLIKAEMKDGILKLLLLKAKPDCKNSGFEISGTETDHVIKHISID